MLRQLLTPEENAIIEERLKAIGASFAELSALAKVAASRAGAGAPPELAEQVQAIEQIGELMRAMLGGETDFSGGIGVGGVVASIGGAAFTLKLPAADEVWPEELHDAGESAE